MTAGVVFPVMGTMNAVMLLAYWSNDPIPLAVIIHSLFCTAFNIWITTKERTFTLFGRKINTRADSVDLWRWSYNLLVTDALMLFFVVKDPMGHMATWLILGLAAQMDTFKRSSRYLTIAMAFMMGFIPCVWNYYALLGPLAVLFVAASYMAIAVVFLTFERTWVRSLTQSVALAQREAEAQRLTERMKSEALIGFQQRTISHEMANLMMVIDLYSRRLPEDAGAAIKRAVAKIKSLNRLVLDRSFDSSAKKRVVVSEFLGDINLLLRRVVESMSVKFTADASSEDIAKMAFDEFDGAAYFILQNLIKNAMEAVLAVPGRQEGQGEVRLVVSIDGAPGTIRFKVEDTGVGMDDIRLARVIAGDANSNKETGHGLGNKLVGQVCERNGFKLNATSQVGVGTVIWFDVPKADMNKLPGEDDLATSVA